MKNLDIFMIDIGSYFTCSSTSSAFYTVIDRRGGIRQEDLAIARLVEDPTRVEEQNPLTADSSVFPSKQAPVFYLEEVDM